MGCACFPALSLSVIWSYIVTQVNVERQLAARADAWQADGDAAPDVQRLSLAEGHAVEKEPPASEDDNAAKAAVEVAASAAAAAAPAPDEDDWLYRDPKGNVQVALKPCSDC